MTMSRRKDALKKDRLAWLRDPMQMRVVVTGIVLTAGYLFVYSPLSAGIDETARKLESEKKRLETACEIECLRAQYKRFKDRLPEKSDVNDWVQYVLDGVRTLPLNLVSLDPGPIREIGPYKVVMLKLDMTGSLADMHQFLHWLETRDRLIRVDSISIQRAQKKEGMLHMKLVVLGVIN
jgi:Tfp pilus assembly protein PilO